jgi:nitrogen regulatory protein P-II 1
LKKIEAVIREEKFFAVKNALAKEGFTSLTTYEVKGRGREGGVVGAASGVQIDLLPKIKIEVVAEDEDTKPIIDIITDNAASGIIGDGKIFVSPIEEVIRIRTKEHDSKAL